MKMNGVTLLGILLIVIGGIFLVVRGISYTTEEEILDVGPIEATAETEETFPLSPVLGGVALVGGILLVAVGSRRT